MGDKSPSHWPITLTNGAAALINIFLPLCLVRILSPEQVGRYSVFFLYVGLSSGLFLVSGLSNGLYHWTGKYPEAKAEVRQSWTLLVVLSVLLSAVGLVFAHRFAPLIHIPDVDMRFFLLSVPFVLCAGFMEDLLIAKGDIWKGSAYSSIFSVIRTLSLLLTAWLTHSVMWMFIIFSIGSAVRMAVGALMLSGTGEIQFSASSKKTAAVLTYALPVSIALLGGMAMANIDQMILSFRITPAKFAFYAMGCLAIPPLQILEASVTRVLIPRLSEAFALNELTRAASLFKKAVSELFQILLPAAVGLTMFAEPIVRILFTTRYMAAAYYLRVFAWSYVLLALPFDVVARARGDGKWILKTSLLFVPLSIACVWYAAGRWDAMGALVALLSTQLALRMYALVTYQRGHLSATYARFLPLQEMVIQTVLAGIAAACALLLRPLFSDLRWWFLVTGPLFTLIYFAGTYAVFLRRHATSREPIHVLELAQTLGLGGLERMVYSLSEALNQSDRFSVMVATYDHERDMPSLAPRFAEAGIPLMQWQKGKGFSFRNVVRLLQIIFSEDTRIVHAHDLGPLIYGSLAKIFSLGRVRLFLTLHTMIDIEQNNRYRWYYKIFLRFPDRIIVVSPSMKTGLQALGVRVKRIHVIPNGVSFMLPNPNALAAEKHALRQEILPQRASEFYATRWMLCLARLTPGKGQDVVLDVWNALPQETRAELSLIFVGQESQRGYAEALHRRIQEGPGREHVVVAGPSEHPEVWIRSSDLFISGSLHEGMPLAPLEAAGCGLPTILSDIEGHRFLWPWAQTFDPAKPEQGARQVVEILKTLKNVGDADFYKKRWNATAPLRERWGTTMMTTSYEETFQS